MRVISNAAVDYGHFSVLAGLFRRAGSVTLVSPFLSVDMKQLLGSFDLLHLNAIHLITTLPPRTKEQFRKLDSIVSVMNLVQEANRTNKLVLRVSIDNKLHGKIYIFRDPGNVPFAAIVTSANFTEAGLRHNHEWGILLEDAAMLNALETSVRESADYVDISVDDADAMLAAADAYRAAHGGPRDTDEVDLDLISVIKPRDKPPEYVSPTTIWLKPIGSADQPFPLDKDFSRDPDRVHFSRRCPRSVSVGDVLIAYGVGPGMVLTYYTVISAPARISDDDMHETWMERWPWYVETRNQASSFGSRWRHLGLRISDLVEQYLAGGGGHAALTAAGGNTLGALQYGADKLRLSSGFGEFVIRKIREASPPPLGRS
ncbi:MAG: restriction endonuclease PLD domain-containing protein [Candidatus Krumholzibacteriia bacterium]